VNNKNKKALAEELAKEAALEGDDKANNEEGLSTTDIM